MSEPGSEREADQIPGIAWPEEAVRLVGHAALANTLELQIENAKLPSAWLLHGPRGIGKATLAFHLIKKLLSKTGDEPAERVNEQVAQGTHPNVFVLRKRRRDARGFYANIRVDEVREIRDRMRQTRGRAGYRVCVVDAIDDCNANAANALLKILEEPPRQTLFILISHRPGALLPTIRSRCQSHAMRALSDTEMGEILSTGFENEPDRHELLRFADGRPRRAHELAAVGQTQVLADLVAWLDAPTAAPAGQHMLIADAIGAASPTEANLSRELLLKALSDRAKVEAIEARAGRSTALASAAQLWEKATQAFANADVYNLDMRQTYLSLFDGYLGIWRDTTPKTQ